MVVASDTGSRFGNQEQATTCRVYREYALAGGGGGDILACWTESSNTRWPHLPVKSVQISSVKTASASVSACQVRSCLMPLAVFYLSIGPTTGSWCDC